MLPPLLLVALLGSPPVLQAPQAALQAVQRDPAAPVLFRAETALLAGAPQEAQAWLAEAPQPLDPRWLRLVIDADAQAGQPTLALGWCERLSRIPGWAMHAARAEAALEAERWDRGLARFGLGLFAVAMAALALGGARELLRPSRETLIGAVGLGLAVLLGRQAGQVLGEVYGLCGAALLGLSHAAAATQRRVQPSPKGRAYLVVLVALGTVGALLAGLSLLSPADVVAAALTGG